MKSKIEWLEMKRAEDEANPSVSATIREEELRPRNGAWPSIKPFVNGFLTGQVYVAPSWVGYFFFKHQLAAAAAQKPHISYDSARKLRELFNPYRQGMKNGFLLQTIYTTGRYGIFETLSKKVADANGGRSLTLHQEASCGLISGAIASSIYYPFHAHLMKQPLELKWNLRNIIHPFYHTIRNQGFLALWKGGSHTINHLAATSMGLFASYGRTSKYYEETLGFGPTKAHIGAGVVSAFFAVTCCNIYNTLLILKDCPYIHLPRATFEVLKPFGGFNFYSKILYSFGVYAPFCVGHWLILEKIQEIEKSNGF